MLFKDRGAQMVFEEVTFLYNTFFGQYRHPPHSPPHTHQELGTRYRMQDLIAGCSLKEGYAFSDLQTIWPSLQTK